MKINFGTMYTQRLLWVNYIIPKRLTSSLTFRSYRFIQFRWLNFYVAVQF